jgi:hypothetical protein
LGTDGEKNIDWIDTDNRLTVKISIRSMVFGRKKNLEPMVRFYRKNKKIFEPMIDTIGQK